MFGQTHHASPGTSTDEKRDAGSGFVARAIGLSKVYGTVGQASITALDDVSVDLGKGAG